MYQDIFTYNFFFNFLISLFFITITVSFSFAVSNKFQANKIKFFDEYRPLVIFFLIFVIYSLIFNILIYLNFFELFDIFFYIFFILQIVYIIFNNNFVNKKKFIFRKLDNLEIYLISFLFILFLISILPISDADSIALHQYFANYIYYNGLDNFNLEKDISFTIFSNTQNLLIISPILKSDNFGSLLNFLTLVFFIFLNFKDNRSFLLILLSSPLIIYFISVQKLQLFFGILYLLLFIIIDKKYFRNKIELFVLILLITFYSSGNLSYILFAAPLFIYLLITNNKDWKNVIFFSFISFFITLFPIFLIKHYYFLNFIAPFFDNLFGNNNYLYNAYAHILRTADGWLGDPSNLSLYLKPFIALNINQFTSSLGIIFLLMLIDIKLLKRTKYFPLIIILLVITTGQILPRYYFEAFLILAFYFNIKDRITKFILFAFNSVVIVSSIIFIYYSYINSNVLLDKNKFMNRFSYTYFNSIELKKLNLKENVLNFNLATQSTFLDPNVFSIRTLGHLRSFDEEKDYLPNFISNNSIKYIIIDKSENLPSCLTLKKIGEVKSKLAVRNFLRKEKINISNVLEITSNNC